jgi:hypothetical protein
MLIRRHGVGQGGDEEVSVGLDTGRQPQRHGRALTDLPGSLLIKRPPAEGNQEPPEDPR